MNREDELQFAELLAATLEVYGKTVSANVVQIWWAVFERYPIDQVRQAFSRYVQNADQGRFPPTPAGVLSMIEETPRQRATMAFCALVHAIKTIGPYWSVSFDDAYIPAVVRDLGGWVYICGAWTSDELKYREQEFVVRYEALKKQGNVDAAAPLLGIVEMENCKNGLKSPEQPAYLIAQSASAKAVRRREYERLRHQ